MVFKSQVIYYMFALEKFGKTAFGNKRGKFPPLMTIRGHLCYFRLISLSETVQASETFRIKVVTYASPLLSH